MDEIWDGLRSRKTDRLLEDFFIVDHDVKREKPLTEYIGYPVMNYPIAYLPQALGITFARILWINNIWVYYAGAIADLLFYALIVALAIKIIPERFRNALVVLALLPMSLHQAASYSYDTFVNAMSFLFIAYLLKLWKGDRLIKAKQSFLLIVIVTLLAPAKIFYGFLGLCVFILPKSKFENRLKYWLTVLSAVILPLVLTLIFKLPQAIDIATLSNSRPWETYTISYIFENPLNTIKIFIDTTFKNGEGFITTFVGSSLAGLSFGVPRYWIFAYCFVLLLSIFPFTESKRELSVKERIIFFSVSFAIYGAMLAAEFVGWTRYGSSLVEGIQGRYFIPIALPLLCVCSNKLLRNYKRDYSNALISCAILLNVVITNYIAKITMLTLGIV
jgi:uncharacterized membrane protein